uniref:Uncharacterized protein n=1 Tax=Rhizophora mucronata TaxID=61149 RepID=A0A2P2R0I8_RHIMU
MLREIDLTNGKIFWPKMTRLQIQVLNTVASFNNQLTRFLPRIHFDGITTRLCPFNTHY